MLVRQLLSYASWLLPHSSAPAPAAKAAPVQHAAANNTAQVSVARASATAAARGHHRAEQLRTATATRCTPDTSPTYAAASRKEKK